MTSDARYTDEPPPPASGGSKPLTEELGGPNSEERQWAMFAHLSGLAAIWVGGAGFLGPLIVWLIKKDSSRFVGDQGKEALNFQLNLLGHVFILLAIAIATCGFGALLFIPWGLYALVMPIIAAVRANGGEHYRYPATIRVVT
jgi:uncharacterized Tic20 family protein